MTETFDQVRRALAAHYATMTGLTSDTVFEHPPHSLQDFPILLLLPSKGTFEYESFGGAEVNKLHQLRGVLVGGVKSDIPEGDEALVPFIDRVPDHLRTSPDLGLGDIVARPAVVREYKFVEFVYTTVSHLAIEFLFEVEVYDDQ
jgi:hypothetical protein